MYLHVELLLTHFEVFCGIVSMCARKKVVGHRKRSGVVGEKERMLWEKRKECSWWGDENFLETPKNCSDIRKLTCSSAGKIQQSVVDLIGEVM